MIRNALRGLAAMLAVAVVLPAGPAPAHDFTLGDLKIIHPASRPNLPDRPMVVYVTIANDGDTPDRLVGARAPGFGAAEVHESVMQGSTMSMRPVAAIELPPHDSVELAPGGLHIMLFGAGHLFKPGESFPMTLVFETAGEVSVDVQVEKPDAGQMGGMKMDHGTTGHGQSGHGTGQTGN